MFGGAAIRLQFEAEFRTGDVDAAMLARASGIVTSGAMEGLLRRYFPKEPPDPRRLVITGQFAETLHDAPPDLAG